jgi:hypothetical protein
MIVGIPNEKPRFVSSENLEINAQHGSLIYLLGNSISPKFNQGRGALGISQ